MPTELEKEYANLKQLQQKYREGECRDKGVAAEKVRSINTIRAMERESAKAGKVLDVTAKANGTYATRVTETDSKRSLQEEYIRRFDAEKTVKIADPGDDQPKEQTLREFHRKRLLGK